MKSLLSTALGALALSFVLASNAPAQESSGEDALAVPAPSAPLPVAEAKKRYLQSQRQLDDLAKGGWGQLQTIEAPLIQREALLAIEVQSPRDRIRAAVSEAFDARRQLQQSELAELENRIARIKRALEIRDAMRDTVIDQRTDELLDQIEERGKSGQPDGTSSSGAGRPRYPGARDGVAIPPAESTADVTDGDARLLQLDVEEARANLDSAQRAYQRVEKLHASRAVEQAILDEQAGKFKRAQIQLERAKAKLDGFLNARGRNRTATDKLPDGDAIAAATNQRLAALDVEQAEANFAEAKTRYERFQRLAADKAIDQSLLDEQAEKYKRAQIELERAKTKLKALDPSPAGEAPASDKLPAQPSADAVERGPRLLERDAETSGARDAPVAHATKTSSDNAPIDESQIVWGATDYEGPGEPIAALQLGYLVEPKRAVYSPREVLTAKLFLKYTGKEPGTFKAPQSEILERLGIDLVLRDAAGDKLDWQWGPAHKEPERSGHNLVELAPGAIYQFPAIKLVVGRAKTLGRRNHEPTVFAYLGEKPGQTARMSFKLTSDGSVPPAGKAMLQSGPFGFRVERPDAKRS